MFSNCRCAEAALYYLYMMADGEVSRSEKVLFTRICGELGLDSGVQADVTAASERLV